jgi:PilZ domain
MALNYASEQRTGPRYVVSLPVRAEWDDAGSGEHIVVEGETENVGPAGALVHLHHLPDVGSRVQLAVLDEVEGATKVQAAAEVLRVERNPAQPLAALQLINATDEWRGLVWEHAAYLHSLPDDNYEED